MRDRHPPTLDIWLGSLLDSIALRRQVHPPGTPPRPRLGGNTSSKPGAQEGGGRHSEYSVYVVWRNGAQEEAQGLQVTPLSPRIRFSPAATPNGLHAATGGSTSAMGAPILPSGSFSRSAW